MKETVKQKIVEINEKVYIAEDGTEFNSKEQCSRYEREQSIKKLSKIKQCLDIEDWANCNGGENMESNEYRWYKPQSNEEIEMLNKYVGDGIILTDEDIGKWICIEESYDSVWVSTLEEGLDYVKKLLDKLGFDMTVNERKGKKNDTIR